MLWKDIPKLGSWARGGGWGWGNEWMCMCVNKERQNLLGYPLPFQSQVFELSQLHTFMYRTHEGPMICNIQPSHGTSTSHREKQRCNWKYPKTVVEICRARQHAEDSPAPTRKISPPVWEQDTNCRHTFCYLHTSTPARSFNFWDLEVQLF